MAGGEGVVPAGAFSTACRRPWVRHVGNVWLVEPFVMRMVRRVTLAPARGEVDAVVEAPAAFGAAELHPPSVATPRRATARRGTATSNSPHVV